MMNNILQVTRSAVRHRCAHFRSRLTTATLLSVTRNKLFCDGRFYCSQPFHSIPCFQYRKPNAIGDERKRFLIREEAVVSHSFLLHWFFPVRGMAGHSKWQNIRHIKGAKDKEKSHLSTKFAQRLRLAVKEGGNDPKFNPKLEKLIAEAKKADMSNAMIENTINQAKQTSFNSSFVEVKFIGNCVLLIEIMTSKLQLARNEMQTVCRKHGGKIKNGCTHGLFEKKGIIHVTPTEKPDLESALELAIDVGAEDVSVESDEDGALYLQFVTGEKSFGTVRKTLEAENHNVTYCEYEYLPIQLYPLDAHGIASLEMLVHKLYQYPDVVKIFNNAAQLE